MLISRILLVDDDAVVLGPWFGKIDGRASPIPEALIPRIEIRYQVIGNLTITD